MFKLTETAHWQEEVQDVAQRIRMRVLEHTLDQNGGYLSQACSSAEMLATLYTHLMRLGPSQAPALPPPFSGVPSQHHALKISGASYNGPKAPDLDRFIVSPTHYSLAVYAALIEIGRMAPEGLAQFNQDGSTVEMIGGEHSPGIELTSGSFGQAPSQAAGIALARKLRGDSGRVWLFMSDGEFQEGQTWEGFQAMSFYKLDNMWIYVDVNGQQVDGLMSKVMNIEPLDKRLEAFGARVCVVDGHDVEALAAPASIPPDGRPTVILAYTNPSQGIEPLEARKPYLHYVRFKNDEERRVLQEFLEQKRGG
ncbi:MAG: transketolase [Anaerolineae bacterium]